MQSKNLLLLLFSFGVTACVGTDFITDPMQIVPQRIEIIPANAALETGKTMSFSAQYYDSTGQADMNAQFNWQSSDPGIATIDAGGRATAIAPGQVQIWAQANNITSTPALLTVVSDPNQVATIVTAPDSATLAIGQMQQFTAVALNLSNDMVARKTFAWRSSDTGIVVVDQNGLATAIAPGRANIIASVDNIDSSPAMVLVSSGNRNGTFVKRPGTSYSVAGTALLEAANDGSLVLRFGSDFSTSSGPGLYVYLSTTNQVGSGSFEVARLQSTQGEQSYALPSSVQIDTFNWVIIHCKPFNVTFGYAELN